MKMSQMIRSIAILFIAGTLLLSCSSDPSVKRVDSSTVTDLSGYWNDTDVRIVADTLIESCLNSAALTNYIRTQKALPVVIVGNFRNDSDEHIDTSILTKKMEAALINSGKVDFVASASERGELRAEREEQQIWASEESAKKLAHELGADFMLIGSVKTMVDQAGNKATRNYYVYAELIDVETNRKMWIGENSDIKKIIQRPSVKF